MNTILLLPLLGTMALVPLLVSAQQGDKLPGAQPAGLGNVRYQDRTSLASLSLLASKVPMFQVNLNNYKYHGNPILHAGGSGQWDERGIERVVVVRVAKKDWRMWFGGNGADGRLRIGLASSEDGIQWSKHPGNPVLEGNEEWEGQRLSPTSILHVNGSFYLYYWGPGHLTPPKVKRIGLAVSPDGITWTKKGIVLDAEPPILNEASSFGGTGVDAAKVFYLREEDRWYMIFTGFGPHGVWNGLAESRDGIQWKKIKAPLVASGGLHNSLGGHWNRGQTLRCPMQIGSLWVALDFLVGEGNCVPAVALTLREWIALGNRVLYPNQDYENRTAPWSVEIAEDWFYIYCQLHGGREQPGSSAIGLIRAPKNSIHQPMVLWEKKRMTEQPELSMILEPDGRRLTFHVIGDQPGEVRFVVWNPAEDRWVELEGTSVQANRLCTLAPTSAHAKLRLKFTPATASIVVSAWAVPE